MRSATSTCSTAEWSTTSAATEIRTDSMLQDLRCVLAAAWLIGKRRSFGPGDAPTFVGVTLILALSPATAAWLPTARAVRVNPVVALRHG